MEGCWWGTIQSFALLVPWGVESIGKEDVEFGTDQGSWPFPINRNWSEARQEIQAKLYWDSGWLQGSENKQQLLLLVPQGPGELVPFMGLGSSKSRGRAGVA